MFQQHRSRNTFFIRNLDTEYLQEGFLISAIASVLLIRFYLTIFHFPIIGGKNIHFAHMLWGGLFMLASLIIFQAFLNKSARHLATILGGIGFGAFIDELGKYITSDNNYFFQPTIALIYVVFIMIFLTVQAIEHYRKINSKEYLINAIEMVKEAVLHNLDREEKRRAIMYLNKSNQNDPIVQSLQKLMREVDTIEQTSVSWFSQIQILLRDIYQRLIAIKGFAWMIVGFFIANSFLALLHALVLIISEYTALGERFALPSFSQLSFIDRGELVFSTISALLVLAGVIVIHRSRLGAYELFKRSILISIFITQFFVFYKDQFFALIGLVSSIFILLILDYIIAQELDTN